MIYYIFQFCAKDPESGGVVGTGSTFAALLLLGPLLVAIGIGDSVVVGSFDGVARALVEKHNVDNPLEIDRLNGIEGMPEYFTILMLLLLLELFSSLRSC